MTRYRVFTENKHKGDILAIFDRYFDGYTVFEVAGRWKGRLESSLVVEILIVDDRLYSVAGILPTPVNMSHRAVMGVIAEEIKLLNAQESVLIERTEVESEFI